jgi:hypothetical protein
VVQQVVVPLLVMGAYDATKAAIARMREVDPRSDVKGLDPPDE